jgi:N-sulfoglucosamine sulfohydrolase
MSRPTLLDVAGAKTSHTFDGTSFAAVLRGEKADASRLRLRRAQQHPRRPRVSHPQHHRRRVALHPQSHARRNLHRKAPHGPARRQRRAQSLLVELDGHRARQPAHLHAGEALHPPPRRAALPHRRRSRRNDQSRDKSEHAAIKAKLSAALDQWLNQQGDPGIPQDTHEAHQAAKKGGHLYFPKD